MKEKENPNDNIDKKEENIAKKKKNLQKLNQMKK